MRKSMNVRLSSPCPTPQTTQSALPSKPTTGRKARRFTPPCAVPAGSVWAEDLLPAQANNLYVFPAVGMAIYATQARRVTDEMFVESARAVADQMTMDQLDHGLLYPPQSNILETEVKTAARVAKVVFENKLARVERPSG